MNAVLRLVALLNLMLVALNLYGLSMTAKLSGYNWLLVSAAVFAGFVAGWLLYASVRR